MQQCAAFPLWQHLSAIPLSNNATPRGAAYATQNENIASIAGIILRIARFTCIVSQYTRDPLHPAVRSCKSMHMTPHNESHFQASESVRDVVIGMADGLTVPFALAAGLTGTAMATTNIVVIAGLAEIAAGSIAMGLGGYLAARTDRDHYLAEREREVRETVELPDKERQEVADVFRAYGMSEDHIIPVVAAISNDQKRWVDFMMRFELGFEEPDPKRARNSAVTIAASYIVGGLVPLAPYMLVADLTRALTVSVAVTLVALFIFGYVKGKLTGISPWRGGVQTVVIGGLASAAAFGLAKWIGKA